MIYKENFAVLIVKGPESFSEDSKIFACGFSLVSHFYCTLHVKKCFSLVQGGYLYATILLRRFPLILNIGDAD